MYECKIAEKLAELRNLKGVTQDEVAQSLSVSNKTISKWENGASTPDLPMLVELSKYYNTTTDALLGLTEEKKGNTHDTVLSSFKGLGLKEALLKIFDTVKSFVPALDPILYRHSEKIKDAFPEGASRYYRSQIGMHEFYEFVASSEYVNIAVMMLKNKDNFSWMKDGEKQEEIVKLFKFLSNEYTISVLYFIHSDACTVNFTADYIAKNTGIEEFRVNEILDELCNVGECSWVTAHLTEGEVKVYECYGDGIILSLVTLAFEKMCGIKSYDYNLNRNSKMIGG